MIDILPGINTTASALTAERMRMEVVTQNLANINTTRTENGQPYQRQQVVFESLLRSQMGKLEPRPVIVSRVEGDQRPPVMVHRPGHPDSDERGMVAMPNINLHEEMADLMTASRAYEANLAVMKNARNMAMQTLSIGKGA